MTGLNETLEPVTPAVTDVAPLAELGSPVLEVALGNQDFAGVLDALADDFVVVPVAAMANGDYGLRVFATVPGSGEPYDAYLFSSAKSLDRFLGECPDRLFLIQHGAAVIGHICSQIDSIARVVFDPAGPHAASVETTVLAELLSEQTIDLDFDQSDLPADTPDDFRVPLPGHWGSIDLSQSPDSINQQVQRLVKRQTKSLGDQGASLRRDMRQWLVQVAKDATGDNAGGRQMAFLLATAGQAGASLAMVTYVHDLGHPIGPETHLELITANLLEGNQTNNATVLIDMGEMPVLRQVKRRHGSKKVGGQDVPMLMADYWTEAPDHCHVAHVSFSTPHVDQSDAVVALTDNIMFTGGWLYHSATAPAASDQLPG